MDNDNSFSTANPDTLMNQLQMQLSQTYGVEIAIEPVDNKAYVIDGYNVIYTDMDGGKYLEEFRTSADTIRGE